MPENLRQPAAILRASRPATAATAARSTTLGPLAAGATVGGLWGGIAGVINYVRYRRNEISGKQALASTASESAGAGIASSAGLIASNVVRTLLLATSVATPLSFGAGVVVTAATKIMWDRTVASLSNKPRDRRTTTG